MYSSPKPFDQLIAPDEILNIDIAHNSELTSYIMSYIRNIEYYIVKGYTSFKNAKLYTTANGIVVERLTGGAKPFGSIRWNFYISKTSEPLTGKPVMGEPHKVFTMIINCRGVDLSTQVEWYFSEEGTQSDYEIIRNELNVRHLEVLYSDTSILTSTNMQDGQIRQALGLLIGVTEGKEFNGIMSSTPNGTVRITSLWQLRQGRHYFDLTLSEMFGARKKYKLLISTPDLTNSRVDYVGDAEAIQKAIEYINSLTKDSERFDPNENA